MELFVLRCLTISKMEELELPEYQRLLESIHLDGWMVVIPSYTTGNFQLRPFHGDDHPNVGGRRNA